MSIKIAQTHCRFDAATVDGRANRNFSDEHQMAWANAISAATLTSHITQSASTTGASDAAANKESDLRKAPAQESSLRFLQETSFPTSTKISGHENEKQADNGQKSGKGNAHARIEEPNLLSNSDEHTQRQSTEGNLQNVELGSRRSQSDRKAISGQLDTQNSPARVAGKKPLSQEHSQLTHLRQDNGRVHFRGKQESAFDIKNVGEGNGSFHASTHFAALSRRNIALNGENANVHPDIVARHSGSEQRTEMALRHSQIGVRQEAARGLQGLDVVYQRETPKSSSLKREVSLQANGSVGSEFGMRTNQFPGYSSSSQVVGAASLAQGETNMQPSLNLAAANLAHRGGGSVRVTMHPESLGEVTVQVEMTASGILHVHLGAARQDSLAALGASTNGLSQHLAQSGFTVGIIQTSHFTGADDHGNQSSARGGRQEHAESFHHSEEDNRRDGELDDTVAAYA